MSLADEIFPSEGHLGLVHLVGQLSNPSPSLQAVFDATSNTPLEPTAQNIGADVLMRRLGNGVVQRAVVKVLAAADRPMCLADVHPAVENLVGHPVSAYSVSWCLAAGTRSKEQRFERTARGYYRLRRPA